MAEKKKVLHVGCGPLNPKKLFRSFRGPEWQEIRLDINPEMEPDIVNSIIDMKDVPTNSMDAVWSSHNLEHLFAHEVTIALAEFHRVLLPGGFVLITLPDIQAVARVIAEGNMDDALFESPAGPISPIDVIWGLRSAIANGNEYMAHKTGFTSASLKRQLMEASFIDPLMEHKGYNLWAVANKAANQAPIPS